MSSRAPLLAAALIALSSAPLAAQQDSTEAAVVRRIRAHYQTVEHELPSYRCREMDLDGYSAEGGTLRACYAPGAGGDVRKVTAMLMGESGRAREEYFFRDGRLVFAFHHAETYTHRLSGVAQLVEEERLYFDDGGRLVGWLGPGTRRHDVTGAEAVREASELTARARHFVACAGDGAADSCEAEENGR